MNIRQTVKSHIRLITVISLIAITVTGITYSYMKKSVTPEKENGLSAQRTLSDAGAAKAADIPRPPMSIAEYNSRSTYGPLPSYMSDVSIDGALQVTPDGHLVRSRKIRQLFDFFLMSLNDEGMHGCSARIEEIISMSLSGEAKNEAMAIWASYKKYRLALSDSKGESDFVTIKNGAEHFENILESRIKLRRKTMPSDIADVFFSEEEAYDRYVIDRFKIQHDQGRSEKEKSDAVKDLISRLPAALSEKETKRREEADFNAEENRLKQNGDEAGVHALRKSRFGSDAADRLAELDKKNDDLNRRIREFDHFQKATNDDPSLTPEEKKQRIETAKIKNFTEWERPLVKPIPSNNTKKGERTT